MKNTVVSYNVKPAGNNEVFISYTMVTDGDTDTEAYETVVVDAPEVMTNEDYAEMVFHQSMMIPEDETITFDRKEDEVPSEGLTAERMAAIEAWVEQYVNEAKNSQEIEGANEEEAKAMHGLMNAMGLDAGRFEDNQAFEAVTDAVVDYLYGDKPKEAIYDEVYKLSH